MVWNPQQYLKFSGHRLRPAVDLLMRIPDFPVRSVADLGAGAGNVTKLIKERWPEAVVVGVEGSAEMVAAGRKAAPGIEWLHQDLGSWRPAQKYDVVYSNAALHWVDDHEKILRGAASVLKSGGRLVVSCGGKGNAQDVFVALRPEIRLKRWREFFRKMPTPYFFYAPGDYKKWLPKFGFKIQKLKLAPKDAIYAGAEDFATWLRTTWIPYVQRVPENVRDEFIAAVTQRYVARHPPAADGKVHVRMVRLEIDAVKM